MKHKWEPLIFIIHVLIQQIFIKHLSWSIKGAKFLNSKIHKTVLALNRITIQLLYLSERMMSSTQVTPLVVYLNSLKSET